VARVGGFLTTSNCTLWVPLHRYEASGPQRNHMLWLLNLVVCLYIALSLYIIGLYGRCTFNGAGPVSPPLVHSLPPPPPPLANDR
jgi:hypothetical protein